MTSSTSGPRGFPPGASGAATPGGSPSGPGSDLRREAGEQTERMRQEAESATEQAKREAARLAEEAKLKAAELTGEAKAGAASMAEQAKAKAQAVLDERKSVAAEQVNDFARALRSAAHELEERQKPSTAHYVSQAASSIERIADHLRQQDLRALVGQAEDLARRQPALFIGGAVAAGFALARFMRSSAEHRADDERESHGRPGTRAPAGYPETAQSYRYPESDVLGSHEGFPGGPAAATNTVPPAGPTTTASPTSPRTTGGTSPGATSPAAPTPGSTTPYR